MAGEKLKELKVNHMDGHIISYPKDRDGVKVLIEYLEHAIPRFKEKYGKSPDFIVLSSKNFGDSKMFEGGIYDGKLDVIFEKHPTGTMFLGVKNNMREEKEEDKSDEKGDN